MMRPCDKCLERNWRFQHIDGWIIATCNICENEVQFLARKKKEKKKVDDFCKWNKKLSKLGLKAIK